MLLENCIQSSVQTKDRRIKMNKVKILIYFALFATVLISCDFGKSNSSSDSDSDKLIINTFTSSENMSGGEIRINEYVSSPSSLYWSFNDDTNIVLSNINLDFTGYKNINIYINVDTLNDPEDKIIITLNSENDSTSGFDYYQTNITLNKIGWNKYIIPISSFNVVRSPLGIDQIDGITLYSSEFGLTNNLSTIVYIDDIYTD